MRFDVALSDRIVDLVDEGYDLAVRIGAPGSENLVARRLGVARLVVCAALAYIARHGAPRTPEDLAAHDCLTYEYLPTRNQWHFRDCAGRERSVKVVGPLHPNNGDLLATAAVQGLGVAYEPDFIVAPELATGRLRPLLEDFEPPVATVYAMYPSRRQLSAKVRAVVDFPAARFEGGTGWG